MLKSNLFKLKNNDLSPAPGRLLIAEPLLSEHHFQRSVILMIECQNGGGMGIVQNKLSNLTLNEIIPDLTKIEDIPIFVVGSLNKDRLFYLPPLGDIIPGAIEVGNYLYIDGDFDVLLTYIRYGNPIRGREKFFYGYSGWEVDELINAIY